MEMNQSAEDIMNFDYEILMKVKLLKRKSMQRTNRIESAVWFEEGEKFDVVAKKGEFLNSKEYYKVRHKTVVEPLYGWYLAIDFEKCNGDE